MKEGEEDVVRRRKKTKEEREGRKRTIKKFSD